LVKAVVDKLFGGASSLKQGNYCRYELLEEVLPLINSKGIRLESILYTVSKANYCRITFKVGDVRVTFDTVGFDYDEEDPSQKVIELSLEFSGEDNWAEGDWSIKFRAQELEFLSKMLRNKRGKREEKG
jgi:hypothetical protein